MGKVKIIYKNIDDIIPYVNNPRINDSGVDKVASSIKNYGFKVPITIDSQNEIITGHTRLLAAKKLKLKEVPCIVADDLTDAQVKAFRIADNKVAEYSEWDNDLLKIEFEVLEDMGFDLELTGFELDKIDLDFGEKQEVEEDNFDVEDAIDDIKEPTVKRGQIYRLGKNRLMCGDSTNEDDVKTLMNGEKADMVFTDPPYGYKYESNYQNKHDMIKNDDKVLDFLPLAYDFMDNNSSLFLCTSHQVIDKWKCLIENKFSYKNMIIWKKNNWSMGDLEGSFAGQHEIILFAHKGRVFLNGKRDTDIWEFKRTPPTLHPTMKPIELISYAINKITCNRVLDLFGGSGSTLIACEQTNKKCYMMELDERYCDVIIKRWEEYTGDKAELLEEVSHGK